MPGLPTEIDLLIDAANEASDTAYLQAIAAQFDGSEDPVPFWEEFRIATSRASMLSLMMGIVKISDRAINLGADLNTEETLKFARTIDLGKGVSIDADQLAEFMARSGGDFVSGPFLDALRSLVDRAPVTSDQVASMIRESIELGRVITELEAGDALLDLTRQSVAMREAIGRQFWVSDVDKDTVVNLKQLVADEIRSVANIPPLNPLNKPQTGFVPFFTEAQAQGAGNLSRARLEMIYRTNLSTAYNDGQAVALRTTEVKKHIPLVMILEFQDTRARPTHKRMNGYINTIEVFEARGLVGPAGFNCRKSLRGVPLGEARRKRLLNADDTINDVALRRYNGGRQALIDSGAYPDEGFEIRVTPSLGAA